MKSFEEFRELWEIEAQNPAHAIDELDHLIFIVMYPDNLEWSFIVEKQMQTTCLHTSGTATGAGTGHRQILCYQSEVNDILKKCSQTHAMIICVGMVFELTVPQTMLSRFYKWARDNQQYCKAHIIARPNKKAYLHHQHIQLNLTQWREHGAPDIFEKWENFERSPENMHDDYTPPWLKVDGLPKIDNFTRTERDIKAFAYHMDNRTQIQTRNWDIMSNKAMGWRDEIDISDRYFEKFMARMDEKFYAENTENLGRIPEGKFDLIFTPTAGYSGEVFAEKLDFEGEVVFYDYCSENIEIKQNIVNMNMDFEDLETYSRVSKQNIVFSSNVPENFANSIKLKNRVKTFVSFEECRELQQKMSDNYDVDYMLIDMIQPDYEKIIEKVRGKKVFFNLSNIFSYHVSHACYTLEELVDSLEYLTNILSENTEYFYLRGKRPTKQSISNPKTFTFKENIGR